MCTAATYKTKDFYFGRTLDYEFSYGDVITITPRNYPFHFRHSDKAPDSQYAIIGMAHVAGDYPLYYDAINEKGLGMAGLNFVGNAVYAEPVSDKENVAVRIHPMDSQPVCHLKRSPPETLNYESHQHTVQ